MSSSQLMGFFLTFVIFAITTGNLLGSFIGLLVMLVIANLPVDKSIK